MTATQASRNFAAMLDEVENGETVLVTRDGVTVARIIPDHTQPGDRIAEVLETHPLSEEDVDELENAIREHREWMDRGLREWPVD
jgi:prevent-host-death family protein